MDADPRDRSKRELRASALARRAARSREEQDEAAGLLAARVMELARAERAETVTAYLSLPGEPGTAPLLAALGAAGVRVLLPVVTEGLDLDWAELTDGETRPGPLGLSEPTGPRQGAYAIQDAGVLVCPGLLGSPRGERLGRGGGCYDRALARALPTAVRCLLLWDDEVLESLPTEPHDQTVDVIVTPSRLIRTSAGRF